MVEADKETVLTPTGDPYPPYPQSNPRNDMRH